MWGRERVQLSRECGGPDRHQVKLVDVNLFHPRNPRRRPIRNTIDTHPETPKILIRKQLIQSHRRYPIHQDKSKKTTIFEETKFIRRNQWLLTMHTTTTRWKLSIKSITSTKTNRRNQHPQIPIFIYPHSISKKRSKTEETSIRRHQSSHIRIQFRRNQRSPHN